MENKILINFGNIIEEMKKKEIRLCLVNRNRGWFVLDKNDNLYQIEIYRHGSYLDNLIKNCIIVEFNLLSISESKYIREWEREIWDVDKVRNFIEEQSEYWQ